MQMQKKVTHKEDGRFLVYYHFPDTATPEETNVFNGIASEGDEEEKKRRREEEQSEASTPNTQHPTPNTGGASHV